MVLLSIFAFLCPATWWHDENVDCPHLYHVIMGSYTLIVRVLKYCLFWGFCPLWFLCFGAFVLWCFSPYWLFSVRTHDRMVCWLSTPVSCDHGIVHLDCWSLKIFSHFGGFCALILILWGFCPILLLIRPHGDENVDCPHLYHVIMGSFTLIVGVLKYFLIFGVFCPPWFWSFGAFVLWCFCNFLLFSVRPHEAWRECWLSTPVSCDHGIVHLDCWSL